MVKRWFESIVRFKHNERASINGVCYTGTDKNISFKKNLTELIILFIYSLTRYDIQKNNIRL